MSRKRGKLSLDEEQFIIDNVSKMSLQEIADKINRNIDPVKRFVEKRKLVAELTTEEKEDYLRLRALLHTKPYWPSIVKSFYDEEIKYYEDNWISMVREFNEEITVGEEMHLKTWLTLQIMQTRSLASQKDIQEQIARVERDLEFEYTLPEGEKDISRIGLLEASLATMKSGLASHVGNHMKLVGEEKDISKILKATREKPRDIKLNEESYWGILEQILNDRQKRLQEGKEAEMHKLAAQKKKEKLGQLHTYRDGSVSRILLNSDTVMWDDNEKENEN